MHFMIAEKSSDVKVKRGSCTAAQASVTSALAAQRYNGGRPFRSQTRAISPKTKASRFRPGRLR